MTFLHGVMSRERPAEMLRRELEPMLAAVQGPALLDAATATFDMPGLACVVAVQRSIDDPQLRVVRRGASGLALASDLRLHDRDGLLTALGLGRTDGRGDDALVLDAYERWGPAFASRIIAEGTFALIDSRASRVVLWRDALGVRPMYLDIEDRGELRFSSDLAAIAAHPRARRRLDLATVRTALEVGFTYAHPERTFQDRVHKLPSAATLQIDPSGQRTESYWAPEHVPARTVTDDAEVIEELRALMRRVVADRVGTARGPLGAHISGGLDSSSIAILASRVLDPTAAGLRAYSWAPSRQRIPDRDDGPDERWLAERAAREAGAELRFAEHTADDLLEVATWDQSRFPAVSLQVEIGVARAARGEGVATMLSGWGGDESVVFNGRGYFAELALRGRLPTVHREFRARQQLHRSSLIANWRGRVFLPLVPTRLLDVVTRQPPWQLPAELRPDFRAQLLQAERLRIPDRWERAGTRRMLVDLLREGHLAARTEAWAAVGQRVGIDYTFPLLDRRVVEFALSLPGHFYFRGGWKRWLYREAMGGILPDEVRWFPHKQDDALNRAMRSLREPYREQFRARAEARRDNPYVDVDRLLDPAPDSGPTGEGAWLVFSTLEAGS